MPVRKYFIAIVPPHELAEKIMAIKQYVAAAYLSKGALRSPAHITLHMPFEYEETREHRLIECLSAFRFSKEVSIRLNNYSCFEPRVIFIDVVKNEPLIQLQKELVQHVKTGLHLYNQAGSLRGFHPHMTVAFRDLKKTLFYKAWEEFRTKTFSESYSCGQIALLRSEEDSWKTHATFSFNQ